MTKALIYNSKKIADVYIADTFMKRFLGYLLCKEQHHEAILIEPCNSIHTFLMKFTIDVLFINDNNEIIRKIEQLKPGRVVMPIKGATMVLEARTGLFHACKLGEIITISNE